MKKGICTKCNKLINVDENANPFECPECHAQIGALDAINLYNRSLSLCKRRGDIAFIGSTNYKKAYEEYSHLLLLADDSLNFLICTTFAKLYCSDLHNIYIKEATDIISKSSDKIEINNDNVKVLSEFLKKFKEDSLLIVKAFSLVKNISNYSLNLYKKSLTEYLYYLKLYLDIYNSLDKLNKFFVEGKDVIEEEITKTNNLLKEDIKVNNNSSDRHDFYNNKKKVVKDIFPNKRLIYKIRIALYICMGVGFIGSIVNLILLSTSSDKLVPGILLAVFLTLFVGGYFIGHNLKSKTYNLNY